MGKVSQTFDFNDLDLEVICDQPFEFELVHPDTEDGLGVFVSVVGTESATFQKFLRGEQNNARKEAFEAQRKGADADKPKPVEEDEDTLCRAIAAAMVGWRTVIDGESKPVITWGGKGIEFSQANAVLWLKKFKWARVQVNRQTGDLGNFTKR